MAQQEKHEYVDFEIEGLGLESDDVRAFGGGGFQLAPEGDWMLTVIDLEKKPSSKNQPMLKVTFEIADEGPNKGVRVYNNYSLQPQALGRLKQFSIACGAQLDKFVSAQHIGQTIRGTVVHVEGQPRVGTQGEALPAGVFANVTNEQPLEDETVAQEETPPPAQTKPPVMRNQQQTPPPAKNTKPTTNGQPRRA